MQTAATASPSQARRLGGQHGTHAARSSVLRACKPRAMRVAAAQGDMAGDVETKPSLRDRAAMLFTGLAATALAFNASTADAATATTPPSSTSSAPKAPTAEPTSARSADQLQAELEKRNAAELSRLSADLSSSQSSVVKNMEDLQKKNADNLKQFVSELEASRSAAVKSVDALQKRVAKEHSAMLQLQMELRSAKAQLDNSQKEVEKEKGLLASAKQSAENAKKEAAEAAAAARSAELALRGQAGMNTLQSPLGIAAASGWGLAAIVALAKKSGPADEIDWSKVEGKDDILRAVEQARMDSDQLKRESDSLTRELNSMQGTVSKLTSQLDQERSQRDTLRETILLLESEVSGMEQRMNAAKSEAATLKKRLEDVKVPVPKRPTLNEILTGQTGSSNRSTSSNSTASTPTSSSNYFSSSSSSANHNNKTPIPVSSSSARSSSSNGNGNSLNGKYDMSAASKALGSSGRAVRAKFTMQMELPFGQSLKLVGSHPALGAWDEARGLTMTWSDGHVWVAEVPLPISTAIEFKAVKASSGTSEWEVGPNHVLLIPDSTTSSTLAVRVEWGAGTAVMDPSRTSMQGEHGKVLATAGALNASPTKPAANGKPKKWASLLG